MGAGVGGLVFSFLIRSLVETYGFSGGMLLLGGVMLHVLIAACLMRPTSYYTRLSTVVDESDLHRPAITSDRENMNDKLLPTPQTDAHSTESSGKGDGGTNDKLLSKTQTDAHTAKLGQKGDQVNGHSVGNLTLKDVEHPLLGFKASPLLTRAIEANHKRMRTYSERGKDSLNVYGSATLFKIPSLSRYASVELSVSSAFDLPALTAEKEKTTPNDEDNNTSTCNRKCAYLTRFVDCSILKRIPFIIWIVCACCLVLLSSIQIFLLPHAIDKGLSIEESHMLNSIISIIDIFSMIGWGLFADQHFLKNYQIISIASMIVATATFFMPLITTKTGFIAYSVLFGLFGRVFFGLYPVVLVDYVGIDNLGKALGINGLIMPTFHALEQPLTGNTNYKYIEVPQ